MELYPYSPIRLQTLVFKHRNNFTFYVCNLLLNRVFSRKVLQIFYRHVNSYMGLTSVIP
jgi:hypothetical protein